MKKLIDAFGRVADDLRVSVTDRCNFRCVYCMPGEGLDWLHKTKLLTFEEIERLVRVFYDLGVRTIRLTGGEPTLRRDLPVLVQMLASIADDLDLAMTTNGFLLEELAGPLADAGLRRVNISIDSLLRHRFAEITRRDALEKVESGMAAAAAAGLTPVKLNCVVVRGTNDDEIHDFAALARRTGFEVRFIEFMPLDADRAWRADRVVTEKEIIDRISERFPLIAESRGPEPASVYRFSDGAPGSVGVIASVSKPFCSTCNRLRITADGAFRTCLFALKETDLRSLVRSGATDEELARAISHAVSLKQAGHDIGGEGFVQPERSMSMIGG